MGFIRTESQGSFTEDKAQAVKTGPDRAGLSPTVRLFEISFLLGKLTVLDKSQTGLQSRTGLMAGSTDRDSNRDLCQPQTRLLCCTYARPEAFSPAISTGTSPG